MYSAVNVPVSSSVFCALGIGSTYTVIANRWLPHRALPFALRFAIFGTSYCSEDNVKYQIRSALLRDLLLLSDILLDSYVLRLRYFYVLRISFRTGNRFVAQSDVGGCC